MLEPSTSTSERSFSALHWVKAYLRSQMGQERLNNHFYFTSINNTHTFKPYWNAKILLLESEHRLGMFGKFNNDRFFYAITLLLIKNNFCINLFFDFLRENYMVWLLKNSLLLVIVRSSDMLISKIIVTNLTCLKGRLGYS